MAESLINCIGSSIEMPSLSSGDRSSSKTVKIRFTARLRPRDCFVASLLAMTAKPVTIVPVRNLKGEIDCGRTDEEIAE